MTTVAEKIGGGYFLKMEPEHYFEVMLKSTDFVTSDRETNGSDAQQSFFSDSFGGMQQPKSAAPEDIVVTVDCTLDEFFNGSIKQVEYERKVVKHDAKTLEVERKVQQIEVKPGFSESSELIYRKDGNQAPGHVNSDLIVKFKQCEHPEYRRVGHDLIFTKKITLQEAFECIPCSFRTLDGRFLTIACDEQISPQTCKLVADEGMPIEGTEQKGNLYLRFDLQFPSQLCLETKQRMIAALSTNEEQLAGV